MAKVIGPGLCLDCRGSIGAQTFSVNRFGNYCSTRIKGVDTRSPYSKYYRHYVFLQAEATWDKLNSETRLLWNEFPDKHPVTDRFGVQQFLTPRLWFLRINFRSLRYFSSFQLVPPEGILPDFFPSFSISNFSSRLLLSWSSGLPSGTGIVVQQARTLSTQPVPSAKKKFAYFLDSLGSTSAYISPTYDGSGGPRGLPPIPSGTWVNNSVSIVDLQGRSSVPLELDLLTL